MNKQKTERKQKTIEPNNYNKNKMSYKLNKKTKKN